ncbi:SRPBCC domain-containing protein [Candidatus Micrarchaeota archaeon]|nr:SRPBCC domain-containing protein [Candidatus Micrarchaeota archaeon]
MPPRVKLVADLTKKYLTCSYRPNGVFHYRLNSPDGLEIWGKWVFKEIDEPKKIVFVSSFSDEHEGVSRHPLSPTWPLELLSTALFSESNGKTTITIKWTPLDASEQERETFNAAFESINKGWSGTFEQLEEYLKKAGK